MSLNVFSYCCRPIYYLKHPIKFIKETASNLRAAYRRVVYGFCYTDVWDMCSWLPEVLIPMLRHLATHASGYPATKEFPTYESWTDWLNSIADVLESTLESNWDGQNEYESDWNKVMDQVHTHKNFTSTWTFTAEQQEQIRKKYWEREVELETQRQNLQRDALISVIKNLKLLWD